MNNQNKISDSIIPDVLGRPKTHGKFESRDELEANVVQLKSDRNLSASSIARICRISAGAASAILKKFDSQKPFRR